MNEGDASVAVKVDQLSTPGEYDPAMLELLQIIWGSGFLSPGGADEISRLLDGVDISGCSVLDIGSGLGAVDALLVERFGAASVVGIDIDPQLVALMRARIAAAGLEGKVRAERVDGGPLPFADQSFDVVFSKDSMVQIPDKQSIFREVRRVLRPGGRFVASDWLRGGTGPYSAEMIEFFRLEGITYSMATLEESAAALRAAGFVDVEVRDRHGWYRDLARRELEALQGPLLPLITERIGAGRAHHFIEDWRQLVVVLDRGELRPGHLRAANPQTTQGKA